ncbi:UNVERIFIED_CONTAM: hypothetical protein FKN15_062086 [Acipenser sinensis]
MATGRGKLFRNYRIGLEKTQSCRTQSVDTGSRALNKEDMPLQSSTKGPEATKSLPTELLFKILSYLDASSLLCVACVNNQFHELANSNLPTELLFKILSYLDASSLLCVACVNNQFHELANSNALWYNVYITETVVGKIWKPKTVDDTAEVMSATSIQEKPDGYWRREYFRKIVWKGKKRWTDQLKTISPFTGLPSNTEKVISPYAVPTDKPLTDDIDPEYGLHGYKLHISLHSAGNIFMSGQFAQLFCKKEYIRNESVRLMVISRNDISQHIAISGKIGTAWNADVLGGVVEYIRNESVRLMVISRNDISQHIAISGKIGTAWNADVLGGVVESCCMMSLTVLDEVQNPFWCVSTPVSMQLSTETSTSYDYMGEYYNIKYNDSEGRVFMELVWLKEHEQFFLTSLVLYITTEKVNKHFRTKY